MEYLVNQALVEWQIYNVNPSTQNYMAEKEMNDAIYYIIKKIILELTDASLEKLSVGYPMDTEEHRIESIKNKAKLVVLNYTIKQNEPKENDIENLPNINTFSNY